MAQAPKPTPKPMEGGAVVETVTVSPLVDDAGDDGIDVITTAPGLLNDRGIIPVGTKCSVKPEAFSENWMKPTSSKSAQAARAELQGRKAKREAKIAEAAQRTAMELARQLGIGAT